MPSCLRFIDVIDRHCILLSLKPKASEGLLHSLARFVACFAKDLSEKSRILKYFIKLASRCFFNFKMKLFPYSKETIKYNLLPNTADKVISKQC